MVSKEQSSILRGPQPSVAYYTTLINVYDLILKIIGFNGIGKYAE